MPLTGTVILDTTDRAIITDNVVTGPKIVRTGIIRDVDATGMDADEIFAAYGELPGIPGFKTYYPAPPYNDCILTGKQFEPFERNPRKIRFALTYERPDLGTPVVTFVLQRETVMIDVITELHPDTFETMVVTWIRFETILGAPIPVETVQRTARFRYRTPFQRVTATGYYKDGPPPAAMLDALGSVNSDEWRGKPAGYWFYASQSDVTRDRGNSYTITLGLETQLRKDWSQYSVLEDNQGRVLAPDPAEVSSLRALPYKYGVDYGNGITKAGLFPLAPFGSIFGFGGIA